eukprot:jgi/Astpho2/1720/fgenesh1_pm.00032_%23_20_t
MLQALSDAHTYLFEERERLLQLQAAHDDLKLQEVEDRRRIQHLLALHSPMEQEITYSRSRYATAAAAAQTAEAAQQQKHAAAEASPQLQLYNTMARTKQPFNPREGQGNRVSMYVCGVTVYDWSHIGHARAYVSFDLLFRLLQHLGYEATYVRNFTDIDDKIIARAHEQQVEPSELTARYIQEFHRDMESLNCLPPTLEPRATDHEMVGTVQRIMDNGHAYSADGDVYFDVGSLPGYGRLSGRAQEDNRSGERVAVDSRKRSPADFALWKAAKPGEPTWESPWGQGRPGWHLECSTMIRELLGPVIDIHGGGFDLVFPHHENEIAQSQAAACDHDRQHMTGDGKDFVRYWMHNGFVNVDSEKMSKSLGNFFTIRTVVERYHPLALRLFLVSTQYRQAINFTQRALEEASDRLFYFYQTLLDCHSALEQLGSEAEQAQIEAQKHLQLYGQALQGLCDDLNSPVALSTLSGPLKQLNDLIHTKKGKKAQDRLQLLAGLRVGIEQSLKLLGLPVKQPGAVLHELKELALKRAELTEQDVEDAIQRRSDARKSKDFAAADGVRDELAAKGVAIMDLPGGTTWRPARGSGPEV